MNFKFFCLFAMLPFLLSSQTADTLTGLQNGPYILNGSNGQLVYKGFFTHGMRSGEWEIHDEGIVNCEYKEGVLNGLYTKKVRDKLRCIWNYKNGERVGEQKNFNSDGKLELVYGMLNNRYEGNYKKYDSEGTLRLEAGYHKGKRHGKTIEYGSDGIKNFEWEFKNGVPNGVFIEYDSKGDAKEKGQMKDGKRDGAWQIYSGKEVKTVNYKDGVIIQAQGKK